MASESGEDPADLTLYAQFRSDPQAFHILTALRVLDAALQDGRPLGRTRLPEQDRVRLGQDPELAFPRTTIAGFTPPEGEEPGRLRNLFFGFWGPNGPMPLHLTEFARDRLRNHRDPGITAFADMITHRMMSLFYRAWAQGQPAPGLDRPEGAGFDAWVGAIAGIGLPGLQDRDAMPDTARRHFAGFLVQGPKNAEGLEQLLGAFLAAPVRVETFIGSWLPLEARDRWHLGQARLGQGTVIGTRVWSRASRIRICIGPLDRAAYEALLPGGAVLDRLMAAVRAYAGLALETEINLALTAADVPRCEVGQGVRLGQTTWLGTRRKTGPAADLILTPAAETGTGATARVAG